jgi:DNA repair photolyase
MAKNYGTVSSLNDTCRFQRDYSYIVNSECLSCEFCYNKVSPPLREKRRTAGLLRLEHENVPFMLDQPITISRYCDPFCNDTIRDNSLTAAFYILTNGGNIIFRTAKAYKNVQLWSLFKEYPKQIQYQVRVISSIGSTTGNLVRESIAPNFDNTQSLLALAKEASDLGVHSTVYFDPYIVGLNSSELERVVVECGNFNIKNIIIKQLFATDYFKSLLIKNLGNRHIELLSVRIGDYSTYDNIMLLNEVKDAVEIADKEGVTLSFCSNKALNNIVSSSDNCCQYKGNYEFTME